VCSSDLHFPGLIMIDERQRLGEFHSLNDIPQAVHNLDLVRAQDAAGFQIMTGDLGDLQDQRSEERRVGERGRTRWAPGD